MPNALPNFNTKKYIYTSNHTHHEIIDRVLKSFHNLKGEHHFFDEITALTQKTNESIPGLLVIDTTHSGESNNSIDTLLNSIFKVFPDHQIITSLAIHSKDKNDIDTVLTYPFTDTIGLPLHPQILEKRLRSLIRQHDATLMYLRHQSLFNLSQDAVISFDANWNVVDWNPASERIYGWQFNQLKEAKLNFSEQPALHNINQDELQEAIDQNAVWNGQIVQRDQNNDPRHILSQIVPVLNEQGQIFEYLAVNRDMTLQRAIEESLRNYQIQASAIFNGMKDLVMIIDAEGRYIDFLTDNQNLAVAPFTDLLGNYIRDFFQPHEVDVFIEVINNVLTTQTSQQLNYELTIDGTNRWFDSTIAPLNNNEVVWVISEITDRTIIMDALRESAEQYQTLFEHASDAIFIIDQHSNMIMDANTQAETLLGYMTTELIGMNLSDLERTTSSHASSTSLHIFRDAHDRIIMEQYFAHKNGEVIPVETSNRYVNYDGTSVILSFVRDIRRRKETAYAEREQRLLAETFRDTAIALNRAFTLDEVLETILQQMARLVPKTSGNIMFVENDMLHMSAKRSYSEEGITYSYGDLEPFPSSTFQNIEQTIIQEHSPNIINDVKAYGSDWKNVGGNHWIKSHMSIPVIVQDNVIAVLNLDSPIINRFNDNHIRRMVDFAEQAALAIQNAQLFQDTQNYADAAEAQLEQERKLLRAIIDNAPDIIYAKDKDLRYILTNNANTNALGAPNSSAVLSYHQKDIDSEATRDDEIEKSIVAGEHRITNQQVYAKLSNGQAQWQLVSKLPLRGQNDEIIGLVGIHRDITELKQAEEQFTQLLDSARCLLWYAIVTEENGNYIWKRQIVNEPAAQRLLPLDTKKQTYAEAWEANIYPSDRDKQRYVFDTHLQYGKGNYALELRVKQADGTLRWMVEDVQIRQLGEKSWRIVSVCTDITERKQAEGVLQRTNEELEQRVQERTRELSQINDTLRSEIRVRQRTEEAERQQRQLAESLIRIMETLISTPESDIVLDKILNSINYIIPSDAAHIVLLDTQNEPRIVRQQNYMPPLQKTAITNDNWQHINQHLTSGGYHFVNVSYG